MVKERAKPCYIGLYPEHLAILKGAKKLTGLKKTSNVIQFIITDWQRLKKKVAHPNPKETKATSSNSI